MLPFVDDSLMLDSAEHRQDPKGPGWSEHHRLFAIGDDGTTAVVLSVGIRTTVGHDAASFHSTVFRNGEAPVVLVEFDIEAPDRLWELRASGLWAEVVCETPYLHWSYGLEAFALAIDDPRELLERGYGERVPLGWELEFESDRDQVLYTGQTDAGPGVEPETAASGGAFSQTGTANGILLFAAGRESAFSGRAVRQHWWGKTAQAPMAALDSQIATLDRATPPGSNDRAGDFAVEVALPLPGGEAEWWLTRSAGGLRSETRAAGDD